MVFFAWNRWMTPSSMESAMTPTHVLLSSDMIRSSAKYSMKYDVSKARERPYRVCKSAWPVRSAQDAQRYACPPLPKSRLCPPNARW